MAPLEVYASFYTSLFKSLLSLVFARLYTSQQPSRRELSGRVAVITGANSGIGLSIAVQLAKQGATVYLACRNLQRGAKAVDHVVALVGEKSKQRISCWELDTSDLTSVRSFCDRWKLEGKKIDMLVHNAGIASPPMNSPKTTKDGKDLTYVTNFLGSFLMTHLLEQCLAEDARVVLTSSTGHYSAAKSLFRSDITKKPKAPGLLGRIWRSISRPLNLEESSALEYGTSKAQQVLFASLLQSHFSSSPNNLRTAHAFTPGFTSTPIFGKFDVSWRTWLSNPLFAILKVTERYVAVDTDEGAKTGSWLAAGEARQGGAYWEWGQKRTSLVDFLRGVLGEREFLRNARQEWTVWEGDAGVKWDVGIW